MVALLTSLIGHFDNIEYCNNKAALFVAIILKLHL